MFGVELRAASVVQAFEPCKSKGEAPAGEQRVSRPEPRPDPIGGSEPVSGRETQDWDSLPDFFFFFFLTELVPVGYGPHLKTESKYYIQIKELPPEWCPSKSRHI